MTSNFSETPVTPMKIKQNQEADTRQPYTTGNVKAKREHSKNDQMFISLMDKKVSPYDSSRKITKEDKQVTGSGVPS